MHRSKIVCGFICLTGLVALGSLQLSAAAPAVASSSTAPVPGAANQARSLLDFDADWRFSLSDIANAAAPTLDDSGWRRLNVPHDWSIEAAFDPALASCTGFLPGGIGWYRKHFQVDDSVRGRRVSIEFDGIYNHSEVWINGFIVGGRPYGYSSFECDLTPYLKCGGADNVIAVRVDHSRFADSRWYTGSGIYRHVRLRITDALHVATWGTAVTTPSVGSKLATVKISTVVTNEAATGQAFSLQSEIISPDGHSVGRVATTGGLVAGAGQEFVQNLPVPNPQLWSLETPQLYTVRTRVFVASNLVDETTTSFGIRTLRFDPDHGFFLNEKPVKLKGVCIHHEAGGLGAAVPEKVLERRLRLLKDLGVNAIRTSHNPPALELLDLCDRLGLLVKDEALDEFTPAKNKWMAGWNSGTPSRAGYSEDFDLWAVRDVVDMVRRDRNHPSVIMWSIGNEIDYANDPFSDPALGHDYRPENPSAHNLVTLAKPLIAAVKAEDSTRPVTMALANVAMSEAVGLPELLDIVGYNYQEWRYPADHAQFPKRFIFGSETSQRYQDWAVVRDNDYVAGQFLWTGIDYLGEAGRWPNHGSGAGLLDLCGFKKPLAWFRQSLWSDRPMVYLCVSRALGNGARGGGRMPVESWNWRTNGEVTIHCFTTCSEAELQLNGRVIGKQLRSAATNGVLNWTLPFEPGEVKVIGRNDGQPVCEYALKTAGAPARLELLPDTTQLSADGRDVAHLEFRVVDAQGVRVPSAENEVSFAVAGPGKIIGLENGNLNTTEPYGTKQRQVFHGRGLAMLQSLPTSGKIVVTASSPDLAPATVTLESR